MSDHLTQREMQSISKLVPAHGPDHFAPELILLQAGIDSQADDKLDRLSLSDEGPANSDRFVATEAM
jgi:acetoin utilization deacetylase AcuC-like enzyme